MICYRDKTFCRAKCVNNECVIKLTDEVRKQAQKIKLPICVADFSKTCEKYQLEVKS